MAKDRLPPRFEVLNDLTAEDVRWYFEYDPKTGKLTWRYRPDVGHAWNQRNAGKEARSQNLGNAARRSDNKSGYKGVYYDKRRGNCWVAKIQLKGKVTWLGTFQSPEAAHEAYCEAAIRVHKDFARFG